MRHVWLLALLLAPLLTAGCSGAGSILDTHGPRAAAIADLWWRLFWIGLGVFGLVMLLLAAALLAQLRRRPADQPHVVRVGQRAELASNGLVVIFGILLPLGVLFTVLIFELRTLTAIAGLPSQPSLTVQVVGHQFWWEVHYPDGGIVTANEIHVPTGGTVLLKLTSEDVIHSLWIPQLMGRMDLNPGQTTTTWFQADESGQYLGECVELCGIQHAHMRFQVLAEPGDQFTDWLQAQQQPAAPPSDPDSARGAQAFAREGCIGCHTIRYGTQSVGGRIGPDLTHVGSRRTIAAGTLDNTLGNMTGWISNPQAIKPGNDMPVLPLDADSLRSLATYLESLK